MSHGLAGIRTTPLIPASAIGGRLNHEDHRGLLWGFLLYRRKTWMLSTMVWVVEPDEGLDPSLLCREMPF